MEARQAALGTQLALDTCRQANKPVTTTIHTFAYRGLKIIYLFSPFALQLIQD